MSTHQLGVGNDHCGDRNGEQTRPGKFQLTHPHSSHTGIFVIFLKTLQQRKFWKTPIKARGTSKSWGKEGENPAFQQHVGQITCVKTARIDSLCVQCVLKERRIVVISTKDRYFSPPVGWGTMSKIVTKLDGKQT